MTKNYVAVVATYILVGMGGEFSMKGGFTPERDREDKERKARLRKLVDEAGSIRAYANKIGLA